MTRSTRLSSCCLRAFLDPLFLTKLIITNTKNNTNERAGFDYGDSGGAFACYMSGEWKLAGVNSKISDSNLMYIPKPWEPMNSRPQSRVTKNGEATVLTPETQEWMKK